MGGAALITVAAAVLSQAVLYEWFLVPRLTGLRQVSIGWWLALAPPILLAVIVFGFFPLSKVYWFSIPFTGISLSLACYVASIVMSRV